MQNSKDQFKQALSSNFGSQMNKDYTQTLMKDMGKFTKEMKEAQKLKGGRADKLSLNGIAKKHKIDLITVAKNFVKGFEVEKEHTKNKDEVTEIVMDHLSEDPKYYQKLKKVESKEHIIRKPLKKGVSDNLVGNTKLYKPIGKFFSISKKDMKEVEDINKTTSAKKEFSIDLQNDPDFQEFKKRAKYNYRGVTDTYGVPNVTTSDPYIKKKTKYGRPGRGKEENNEATSSGSSGAYVGPLFGGENQFIKKSEKETPKLKEGLLSVGGETTEATTSSSSGSYETPAMWAKSTKKKDWGPSRKTQYPGGSFVKVKKKCTKFPYCNQGDINALKLSKNENVKEAIKNVSKKYSISEDVIKTILEYEYSKIKA